MDRGRGDVLGFGLDSITSKSLGSDTGGNYSDKFELLEDRHNNNEESFLGKLSFFYNVIKSSKSECGGGDR